LENPPVNVDSKALLDAIAFILAYVEAKALADTVVVTPA